jgi:hypothetical protein
MSMVAIVRIGIGHDPPHAAGLAAVAITRRMMSGLAGLLDGNRLDGIDPRLLVQRKIETSADFGRREASLQGRQTRAPPKSAVADVDTFWCRGWASATSARIPPCVPHKRGRGVLGFADPARHRFAPPRKENSRDRQADEPIMTAAWFGGRNQPARLLPHLLGLLDLKALCGVIAAVRGPRRRVVRSKGGCR